MKRSKIEVGVGDGHVGGHHVLHQVLTVGVGRMVGDNVGEHDEVSIQLPAANVPLLW